VSRVVILAIAFTLSVPLAANPQTRKRTSKKTGTAAEAKSSDVVHAGATRVADQIKALTRFIYLLGGVAKSMDQTDAAIKRQEGSPAVVEQFQRDKARLNQTFQTVREGLDKLEIDFRSSPELNRYYIKLAGTASSAATAENQASNGQLDQAGRSLLNVVNRLTDVLLEMQK